MWIVKVRKDGYGQEEFVSGFAVTQDYSSRVASDGGITESLNCINNDSFIIGFSNESYF